MTTSLTRMKNAILRKAAEPVNNGTVSPDNHGFSHGDRFGRITQKSLERNAHIMAAIAELEAEGKIAGTRYRDIWMVVGADYANRG